LVIIFDGSTLQDLAETKYKCYNNTIRSNVYVNSIFLDNLSPNKLDAKFFGWNLIQLKSYLLQLFGTVNSIKFFGDTHERTNLHIAIIHDLFSGLCANIEVNFYAECHGHSDSDTHFGNIKKAMKKVEGGKILGLIDILKSISSVSNTHWNFTPKIKLDEKWLIRSVKIPNIMKFFKFEINPDSIKCFENSEETKFFEYELTDKKMNFIVLNNYRNKEEDNDNDLDEDFSNENDTLDIQKENTFREFLSQNETWNQNINSQKEENNLSTSENIESKIQNINFTNISQLKERLIQLRKIKTKVPNPNPDFILERVTDFIKVGLENDELVFEILLNHKSKNETLKLLKLTDSKYSISKLAKAKFDLFYSSIEGASNLLDVFDSKEEKNEIEKNEKEEIIQEKYEIEKK